MADVFYLDPVPENKPAVILIHGLGTEAISWTYQTSALAKAGFRPVVPDLPGFGRSNFQGEKWTIRQAAAGIIELADRLSINNFHLAGISMGGTVALQTAIDSPECLLSLCLINTFATLRPRRWNEWFYLLRRYLRARFRGVEAQAELTAKRVFPRPDQEGLRHELISHIQQTDPIVYRTAMRELGLYDVRKYLKDIKTPTLVISGENDTTVPLENQIDLARGIPGSRQIFVQDAGHGLIVDQPEAVNGILLQFFRQHSI